ncbi:MAG: chromosome partitioning protein ParB, partial [Candidatus Hydrothermia bacterium]|nr:chromosome partitioning protein ParB [Candidatus Hydrothermia bacterium]
AEPVKVFLRDGSISEGHAKLILALDEKEQVQLANRIVRNRLSVRETERLIQRLKSEQEKSTRTKYVKMVSNTTGLRVSVKISKSGAGEVTIRFNNKEEFVKLAKILGLKPEK